MYSLDAPGRSTGLAALVEAELEAMIAGAHRDAHRMLGAFDGRLGPSGPEVVEFRSAAESDASEVGEMRNVHSTWSRDPRAPAARCADGRIRPLSSRNDAPRLSTANHGRLRSPIVIVFDRSTIGRAGELVSDRIDDRAGAGRALHGRRCGRRAGPLGEPPAERPVKPAGRRNPEVPATRSRCSEQLGQHGGPRAAGRPGPARGPSASAGRVRLRPDPRHPCR